MVRLVVVMAAAAGCYAPQPQAGSPCPDNLCAAPLVCSPATQTCEATAIDAAEAPDARDIDAAVLVDATAGCFGVGLVTICPTTQPTTALQLGDTLIDTDSEPRCITYTGTSPAGFCVLAGTTINVQGNVRAVGKRPLVLLATQTIMIAGRLDVASQRAGMMTGAAAHPTACLAGEIATGDRGGPGGSFGGAGGSGGAGESSGKVAAAPASGPLELRGGCRGGDGSSGAGGAGGGAVYLIAGDTISISGVIDASGAGGSGGGEAEGGGGGGSGGMIGLDAPDILAGGQVFANGGGGGASDGGSGGDESTSPLIAGRGGRQNDAGGADGGDGSAALRLDGDDGRSESDGGGGGGGGAGVIKVFPLRSIGGLVSPAPT